MDGLGLGQAEFKYKLCSFLAVPLGEAVKVLCSPLRNGTSGAGLLHIAIVRIRRQSTCEQTQCMPNALKVRCGLSSNANIPGH